MQSNSEILKHNQSVNDQINEKKREIHELKKQYMFSDGSFINFSNSNFVCDTCTNNYLDNEGLINKDIFDQMNKIEADLYLQSLIKKQISNLIDGELKLSKTYFTIKKLNIRYKFKIGNYRLNRLSNNLFSYQILHTVHGNEGKKPAE